MRRAAPIIVSVMVLLALLIGMPHAGPLFAWAFPGTVPPVYDRGSFLALAAWHVGLVLVAVGAAVLVGVGAAVGVTRPGGQAAAGLVDLVAKTGQSFPPAAVLAVLVPAVGFGALPTVLALFAYSLLPITENMIAGLRGVPATVLEAALGVGMPGWRVLLFVELPLAWPQGLAGIRTAAAISLGTATIGSTVGALTLGTPIIDGLVTNKPGFVLQGAVPLAVLALVVDLAFSEMEKRQQKE
jgi:osmoprotectant transport system permease protein